MYSLYVNRKGSEHIWIIFTQILLVSILIAIVYSSAQLSESRILEEAIVTDYALLIESMPATGVFDIHTTLLDRERTIHIQEGSVRIIIDDSIIAHRFLLDEGVRITDTTVGGMVHHWIKTPARIELRAASLARRCPQIQTTFTSLRINAQRDIEQALRIEIDRRNLLSLDSINVAQPDVTLIIERTDIPEIRIERGEGAQNAALGCHLQTTLGGVVDITQETQTGARIQVPLGTETSLVAEQIADALERYAR